MDKYCEYCKHDERHRKIKLIIEIEKDYYEMIKYDAEHGQNYKYFEIIANGKPYEERPKGEWLLVDDTEKFIAKCSVCGRIEDSRMVKDYPYCHCGAKMKGGAI